jgi:NAD(P)-dependent dehydrogenase (short-subunit alcohol dehydrogenase family)
MGFARAGHGLNGGRVVRKIEGMSVLITGGGSGLGEGTARRLASLGAKVTITGRRKDKIEAVAASIGPNCVAVAGDVAKAADRAVMIDAALAHGGGLQALINNAANMYRGPIAELDEAKILDLFNTNVVAGMMLTGLASEHLARDGGAVVFVSSVHTLRAYPGASPYAATKGAISALTRVLAAELGAKGICVNCVVPGAVPTELNIRAGLFTEEQHAARMNAIAPDHALKRVGTPAELAEAIEYLIRAEWVTGSLLVVDGGLSLGLSNF